jgi:hypothetical protein
LMTSLIRSGSSARILSASYCAAVPFMPATLLQSTRANDASDNRCDFKTFNASPTNCAWRLPESQTCALDTKPHVACADRQRIRTPDLNHLDRCAFETNYAAHVPTGTQ